MNHCYLDRLYFDEEQWEEDEYDIPPSTEYLVYYNNDDRPLACCRLIRTDISYKLGNVTKSYILKDIFNGEADDTRNLIFGSHVLKGTSSVLEGTRFAVASHLLTCLLYTSPSPRDLSTSRMPSSA